MKNAKTRCLFPRKTTALGGFEPSLFGGVLKLACNLSQILAALLINCFTQVKLRYSFFQRVMVTLPLAQSSIFIKYTVVLAFPFLFLNLNM